MKTLKIMSMLLLFLSLLACKKDNAVTPEAIDPIEETFDIKQFVLVTRQTNAEGWVRDIQLRSFEAQSKCIIFGEGGDIPDNGFTYSYDKGILRLFYDLQLKNELKIENNTITSATVGVAGSSFKLIKIPADNALKGNTYAGGWKSQGSLLTTIASIQFTDTHYSEASINLPLPDKTYELFKNVAAFKYNATDKVTTLWLLSEGRLEGYRKYYNSNSRVTGTFTKK